LRDIDIAWLAGLYEGEGTCGVFGKNKSVQAVIQMRDEDVIRRVNDLFPATRIGFHEDKRPNHSAMYLWRIQDRHRVKRFLELIMPYMGRRRAEQAQDVLDFIAENAASYNRRDFS
jgi:hypothetical protein